VDAETLFALLEIAEPSPSDPIGVALLKVVEELALVKRPIEGHDGAYEQEPAELGQLRARLFHILCGAGPKAQLAGQILMQIERHRDEYGRPLSESRHPDITSGLPWPAAAEAAWADAVCLPNRVSVTSTSNDSHPTNGNQVGRSAARKGTPSS
jgi:NACHT conflict system protein